MPDVIMTHDAGAARVAAGRLHACLFEITSRVYESARSFTDLELQRREPSTHPSRAPLMGFRAVRHTIEMADESFGRRLRSERERRRITLELIAANTKIGVALLKGLERDDLSRWPSGLFRRSFMRSYAGAIGLDAEETVREFLERFPDPQTPVAADAAANGSRSTNPQRASLRLTLADPRPPFSSGRILARASRRLAAAACDVTMTLALALTAFVFIDEFWAPLGVAMLCYYTGGVLVLGNTPGVFLFAPRSNDDSRWLGPEVSGEPGGSDPTEIAFCIGSETPS
jgi:transcriptional regulator with XRE-family HTH domain